MRCNIFPDKIIKAIFLHGNGLNCIQAHHLAIFEYQPASKAENNPKIIAKNYTEYHESRKKALIRSIKAKTLLTL